MKKRFKMMLINHNEFIRAIQCWISTTSIVCVAWCGPPAISVLRQSQCILHPTSLESVGVPTVFGGFFAVFTPHREPHPLSHKLVSILPITTHKYFLSLITFETRSFITLSSHFIPDSFQCSRPTTPRMPLSFTCQLFLHSRLYMHTVQCLNI